MSHQYEQPLSSKEKAGFWFHYWLCFTCRRVNRQIDVIHTSIKNLEESEVDLVKPELTLSNESRSRIKDKISHMIH